MLEAIFRRFRPQLFRVAEKTPAPETRQDRISKNVQAWLSESGFTGQPDQPVFRAVTNKGDRQYSVFVTNYFFDKKVSVTKIKFISDIPGVDEYWEHSLSRNSNGSINLAGTYFFHEKCDVSGPGVQISWGEYNYDGKRKHRLDAPASSEDVLSQFEELLRGLPPARQIVRN